MNTAKGTTIGDVHAASCEQWAASLAASHLLLKAHPPFFRRPAPGAVAAYDAAQERCHAAQVRYRAAQLAAGFDYLAQRAYLDAIDVEAVAVAAALGAL